MFKLNIRPKEQAQAAHPHKHTLIDKLTHEAKTARLPDEKVQPNMHALKKVHGKTDTTCSPVLSSKKSAPEKVSLLQKNLTACLQKTKVKPPCKSQTKPKRDLLYGAGITKRKVEQANRNFSKQTSAPIADLPDQKITDLAELPDNLVDPNLTLDEYQARAVKGLQDQKFGVLMGAAGTGKTTTVKFLVKALETQVATMTSDNFTGAMPAIAFCSFMGKAVQQIKRALPERYHPLVQTIHSLLGFRPVMEPYFNETTKEWKERMQFRPSYNSTCKLPHKLIVIDETGSLALSLWHCLLDACIDDCRILMIGDLNQLPPVQGHSILGFALLKWPTFALEKLHRQAEGDPIAENAHRILQGKKPLTDKITKKFIVRKIEDGSIKARRDLLCIVQHLHKQGQFDPMQDALIVPQNIGPVGQIDLNAILENYFNPPKHDESGKLLNPKILIKAGFSHTIFAVGDKVMLLANDTQRALTNGMQGVVTNIVPNGAFMGETLDLSANNIEIDLSKLEKAIDTTENADKDASEKIGERASSHIMTVKLQNVKEEITFNTAGAFTNIALAYAMTCHKAQGSEYRNVIVLAHAVNLKMLSREWLYTAITRAKERVFLICNHRGLTHAVNNQRIKGNTIAEKAKKFLKLQTSLNGESPARLPEPQEIVSLQPVFINENSTS